MQKRIAIIIIITLIIIINIITPSNTININSQLPDINTIEIAANANLKIEKEKKITLIAKLDPFNNNSNKIYTWESTNQEVAEVDKEGTITTKKTGTTYIKTSSKKQTTTTKLTVYEQKKIIIIVGDSRMDNFKDDNKFQETDNYEIKYKDKETTFSPYERIYVVSLSGMEYDWFYGQGKYKNNNATKYVQNIIEQYASKTTETTNYEIKILFNLGVNDIKSKSAQEIAQKYLETIDERLNNQWANSKINKITLNMVTLFPIQDEQIKCHFPGRYNKTVIEFNQYIQNNYQGTICDAYNDLKFTDESFRTSTTNQSCATRDGLHFSKEFNTQVLYPYLINYCANK